MPKLPSANSIVGVVPLVDHQRVRHRRVARGAGRPWPPLVPGPAEARLEADGWPADGARRLVDRDPLRARLERVADDAALVVALVGRVARRGVERVGDRADALRQDRRVPRGADVRQDRVRDLEEVVLDADVRRRQRLAARVLVRARRPHEVAAVGVDVVRELDALERVRDPVLVPDLRLGRLARTGERLAGAARARAVVAVEQRADRVVAVEVDAPLEPRAGAAGGLRDRAVVRQVLALDGVLVERRVATVRVDRRDDEDVRACRRTPSSSGPSRSS